VKPANTLAETQLRERLVAALVETPPSASLYLRALGCVYLATDDAVEEAALEVLYRKQVETEGIDGDDLLTQLILDAKTEGGPDAES
jgi:hypothetical protein